MLTRKRIKGKRTTENFEMILDGKTVPVTATCYLTYNKETRYRVSIDNGPIVTFSWNDDLKRYTSIEGTELPQRIDEAIAMQIDQRMAA